MEHRAEGVRPGPQERFGDGKEPFQGRDPQAGRGGTDAARRRQQNEPTHPRQSVEGKLLRHRPPWENR